MSKKPWQKADQKSAFLMASWLFNTNKSGKSAAGQGSPSGKDVMDKTQADVAKELQESSKAGAGDAVEEDLFPVEFVECFYSGDEMEESQDCNGNIHGQKLQGNAMANGKAGSGKNANVLKAESTITAN